MDDDRFYVKTLTLENFRCFEHTELGPFDPHFNLLVGENGSGKSSVLVALASLIPGFAWAEYSPSGMVIISRRDIRLMHHRGAGGVVSVEVRHPLRVEASLNLRGSSIRAFGELKPSPANEKFQPRFEGENLTRADDDDTKFGEAFGVWTATQIGLFAFYRTGRAFVRAATAGELGNVSQVLRRAASENWFDAGTAAESLREWVKNQTLAYYQRKARERDTGVANRQTPPVEILNLVARAVREAIDDVKGFEFDADFDDILVEFDDGERRDFSRMSDGLRTFVGLVADIARRACLLNAAYLGNETLKETPGLVLIDEIDLHLHPKWQRQIVGALKRIFPKIQFFATTHSPQVIGQAEPKEIVLLNNDGRQERPSRSFGMDSNWVLEVLMRAEGRDPAVAAKIKEVFSAIEAGHFEDAKREIETLRELIGEDRDLAAAEAYLWNLGLDSDEAAE